MKNKRKILFAIIVVAILVMGIVVLLKLKSNNILFSNMNDTLSALTGKSILMGEEVTLNDKNLILGDANQDGKVNKDDVTYVLKSLTDKTKVTKKGEYLYIELGDENKKCADVNQDGKVNVDDVIMLNKYVVTRPDTGYLDSYVAEVDGITWMYDAKKVNGKYYADNVIYLSGYRSGKDLIIPESFTNNYTWETRKLSAGSFLLLSSTDLSVSKTGNGIVIPKTVTTIADETFLSLS